MVPEPLLLVRGHVVHVVRPQIGFLLESWPPQIVFDFSSAFRFSFSLFCFFFVQCCDRSTGGSSSSRRRRFCGLGAVAGVLELDRHVMI